MDLRAENSNTNHSDAHARDRRRGKSAHL